MTERQAVTAGIFGLIIVMLGMACWEPRLWTLDPFKTVLQAVVITGLLNLILAFHFAANKGNEDATKNTGAAFEAIKAAQLSPGPSADAGEAAQDTADAAQGVADQIKGQGA